MAPSFILRIGGSAVVRSFCGAIGVGVFLLSLTARAHPLEGDVLPCRRWKAVLLDLSPLGVRIHLPESWPSSAGYRRFSMNAEGIVAGSAAVAPSIGAALTEVAWAWSPRVLPAYALSAGTTRLPGLLETPEDPAQSAACDVSDGGFTVGVSRGVAVRWDLTAAGTPVSAFAITPAPAAESAALGIDRVGGTVVAGMTTENCAGSGPGSGGVYARAFLGDSTTLAGTMLANQLWVGSTSIYRGEVFGFACDGASIWGAGRLEFAQSCGPDVLYPCPFQTSLAFRWIGSPTSESHVLAVLGSMQLGSEAIRARDTDILVGRALDPAPNPACAPRALIWQDLSKALPWSEDLQAYVTLAPTADSSIALGVRRHLGGGIRVAGATAAASGSGIVANYDAAVLWDECEGGWHAKHPLVPTLVHDLDASNATLWRPECADWRALVAYDATESGLFVGSSSTPSNRVFVATRLTDINADLVINALDIASMLGAWGATASSPCEPLAQDTNLDGQVDARDLAELLGDWTAGVITGLDSFCCDSTAISLEELELALALSGERDIDTFRTHAAQLTTSALDARCASIHEVLEAIRHAAH
jgi:hypothetical protein